MNSHRVADLFYETLFTDYPQAKGFFSTVDMPMQKKALISALTIAVENLDKPDPLTRHLLEIGERLALYGVEEVHYDWARASLLKAFGHVLDDKWTSNLQTQWSEVFGLMAEAIKVGARKAQSNARSTQGSRLRDMSHSSLEIALPADVLEHIHISVEQVVQKLVQAEVKRCFENQMTKLLGMKPSELLKKAS